ncbi:hybrid sensor histidine kinase/response regulator [Moorena sp. SIOASIH]|uniref:hybrid sensor histidine kinase/response regulator n=1 Tax=Moorena sp. SIOASIH TaxID=2607817 RepID=UPI0025FD0A89|nr:hybrid sensor histidine kinase/response regulator [Moorena sp. SIOASIH]
MIILIRYSQVSTPYSLLPTPYSLLPTPYSLLPTPYSLLPKKMSTIDPETYRYFLGEAQDLLQVIEQHLLALKPDKPKNQLYDLMRATHTLKGAAANVQQDTIKSVAHYLEDVFRAMLAPEATIDTELETLLFEGYQCLRMALTAEMTGELSKNTEIINRAAGVFAKLQAKLGDCFDYQASLPTSAELGFDIVQSIFEVGVKQRIDHLASLLKVESSEGLQVGRLKVESSEGLQVGRLDVESSEGLQVGRLDVESSEGLQVGRLDVESSEGLQVGRLQVESFPDNLEPWSKGHATRTTNTNLQPNHLQPWPIGHATRTTETNLQPNHLQPPTQTNLQPNHLQPPTETNLQPANLQPWPIGHATRTTETNLQPWPIGHATRTTPDYDKATLIEIADTLREQAEIFVGLGESLSLPGFKAIAEHTLRALDAQPEQVMEIAKIALRNFQEAHTAVLAGDRTRGGNPSLPLQQLAGSQEELQVEGSPSLQVEGWKVEGWNVEGCLENLGQKATLREQPATQTQLGQKATLSEQPSTQTNLKPATETNLQPANLQPANLQPANLGQKATLREQPSPPIDELLEETFGNISLAQEQANQVFPEEESLEPDSILPDSIFPDTIFLDESSETLATDNLNQAQTDPKQESELAVNPESVKELKEISISPSDRESAEAGVPLLADGSIKTSATVRVDLDGLKHLSHLVGELLINQNQLGWQDENCQGVVEKLSNWLKQHRQTLTQLRTQLKKHSSDQQISKLWDSAWEETLQLTQATEDLSLLATTAAASVEREQRLSNQLRDTLQSVRTIPLEHLLKSFPSMVQQLSNVHHKSAELTLSVTNVLIDKTIANHLYDALLHLVRNGFDHGIESSEVRQERGKPAIGKIEIRAFYQGNRTIIEVTDDGQGLDLEKIYNRAVETNLLSVEHLEALGESPEPNQLLDLLCQPGFSTVSQINELSGRGIGLDVVRSQLQRINGRVKVRFQPGQGTTFCLQIQEALRNARVLVVQASQGVYGFVANDIEQIVLPASEQIQMVSDQKILNWHHRGNEYSTPVYQLSSLLEYSSQQVSTLPAWNPLLTKPQQINPVLLMNTGEAWVGLEVEQVLEEQELVIKQLSNAIAYPPYVYGCSILADGRLTLVIDGTGLLNYVQQLPQSQRSLLKVGRLKVGRLKVEGSEELKVGRLKVEGSEELKVSRLKVEGSEELKVSRLKVEGSEELKVSRLNVVRVRAASALPKAWPKGQGFPDKLQPNHRQADNLPYSNAKGEQPDNLQPNNLQPANLPYSNAKGEQPGNLSKTFLVVDDSITERQNLSLILERNGNQVLQAKDGLEAIELLRKSNGVDLIICDLEMPRLNGLEFLSLSHQEPVLADIPIIMLTSRSQEKYKQLATELGAMAYLTKPYLDEDILATLTNVLRMKDELYIAKGTGNREQGTGNRE